MSNTTINFEEKCTELSKKVFSGHPVSQKEQDAHNIYWQYVQVINRGFKPWLLDAEKEEAKNTLYSLHRAGLIQVADLTELAIDLLADTVLEKEANTENAPGDLNQKIETLAEIDQRYAKLKTDIESAVVSYLK